MKFKKSLLIICIIICLFAMQSVSAIDANDTAIAATEDSLEIDQAADDVIGVEDDMELASSGTNEVLKADEQTFTDLNEAINGNDDNDIYLTSDYKYSSEDSSFNMGIVINRDVNIYGNGHTINGSDEARIFKINVGNVVFYNITFVNGKTTSYGGAILGKCMAINCTFKENYADEGGAMYEGSAVNCTFTNNTANIYGGAMFGGYKAVCIGQENDFYKTTELILHFYANDFATIYGSGEKLPIKLMNQNNESINFIDYDIVIYNETGVVYTYHCKSNDDLSFDLPIGIYTAELIVTYPGLTQTEPKNITVTITDGTTFWDLNKTINDNTNDTITLDKDYAYNLASDYDFTKGINITKTVTINGNGHTIDGKGKACILWVRGNNVNINNITFVNGKAYAGGAIFWEGDNGTVSDSSFIGNNASQYGGAICLWGDNGTVSGSCFIGNNASQYGGAIFCVGDDGVIFSSCFIGNNASQYGGAIVWLGENGNISNSIIINNSATDSPSIYSNMDIRVDYCWFGSNATNYMDALPIEQNVKCNYILFLNATANPNAVLAFNTSEIVFKLYINTTGNASEYDNTLLLPVNLTITSTNGDVDDSVVNLGDSIRYVATGVGNASVTATLGTAEFTIKLNNIMADPNLSAEEQVVSYGENAIIALKYASNATGKVNITLTGKKGNFTYLNLDLNETFVFSDVIPADEYNVSVVYSGDENFCNATANARLTVNKAKTKLTTNAVTATYNVNKNLVITLKDDGGKALSGVKVTVNLNGAKTYTTDKNGQIKINVANMVPKAYSAKITFAGNDNYMASSANVKVTVKKAKAKIAAKKKTFKKSKKVKKYKVTLKSGKNPVKKVKVTIKIGKKTFKAKTNAKGKATFKIKKLTKKGKYKAVIKFKGNQYYTKATKKVKIRIK